MSGSLPMLKRIIRFLIFRKKKAGKTVKTEQKITSFKNCLKLKKATVFF